MPEVIQRCYHRDARGRCSATRASSGPSVQAWLCDRHVPGARPVRFETDRFDEMYRLRVNEGLSLDAIGARYGVTRERVRQILAERLGGSSGGDEAHARRLREFARRREERIEALRQRIRDDGLQDLDGAEIVAILADGENPRGSFYKDVLEALRLDGRTGLNRRLRQSARRMGKNAFSDEGLFAALRTASEFYGGRAITANEYEKVAAENLFPSYQTMLLRFATWREACLQAGIPAPLPRQLRSDYKTPERCWEDLRACIRETGDPRPSLDAYGRWAHQKGRGLPRGARPACQAILRRRLGGWGDVLRQLEAERLKRVRPGRGNKTL